MKVAVTLFLAITAAFANTSTGRGVPEEAGKNNRWYNNYDQPLNFQCQAHQSIGMIISIHHNSHEDRLWDFSCKDTFSRASSCYWTGYVNDFDQPFDFVCPFGSVLSGMDSFHDNKREDRRWRFLCCSGEISVSKDCKWSNYVNEFDDYLRWDAPPNYYLVGASSFHDNNREDRRWRYHYCAK
ncbi:hemagglutinin/amebocyte aggregation factor-like isoform 1-T1 [Discoglossus pictus]